MSPPFYTLTCHTKPVKFITFNELMSPTAAHWLLFIFISSLTSHIVGLSVQKIIPLLPKGHIMFAPMSF